MFKFVFLLSSIAVASATAAAAALATSAKASNTQDIPKHLAKALLAKRPDEEKVTESTRKWVEHMKNLDKSKATPVRPLRASKTLQTTDDTKTLNDEGVYTWNAVKCDATNDGLPGVDENYQSYTTSNIFQQCFSGAGDEGSWFYKMLSVDVNAISDNADIDEARVHAIWCYSSDCSSECSFDYDPPIDELDRFYWFSYSVGEPSESCIAESLDYTCTDALAESTPCDTIYYPMETSIMDEIPDGTNMLVMHFFYNLGRNTLKACLAASKNGLSDGFQTVPAPSTYLDEFIGELKQVYIMDTCLRTLPNVIYDPNYSYMFKTDGNCGDYVYWNNQDCDGEVDGSSNLLAYFNDDDTGILPSAYGMDTCTFLEYESYMSTYCSVKGKDVSPEDSENWDETKKIAVAGLVLASILGVAGVAMSAYVLIAGPMAAKQAVPAVEMTTV